MLQLLLRERLSIASQEIVALKFTKEAIGRFSDGITTVNPLNSSIIQSHVVQTTCNDFQTKIVPKVEPVRTANKLQFG